MPSWTTSGEIDDFSRVTKTIEILRKPGVAKPADKPNTNNSFLDKEYSIALAVNILVQKTIVSGLDIVKIKAEIKLAEISEKLLSILTFIVTKLKLFTII